MRFIYSSRDRPDIIEGMCRWAGPRIGWSFDPRHTTGISVLCEHGAATVLYTDYLPKTDVRFHIAGVGNWLNRTVIDEFLGYPYRYMGVRRISAWIRKKNKPSRKLAERIGFCYEGALRRAAPNGDSIIIYGLLRHECKWLKEEADVLEEVA